ncbi:MAG: sirohydrochlorin cobaltochelatase [Thermodesulfobacteriota bacterium]|nr:sirohydrochlorin cobaltochelatase [Thermodesulfobacteriota bacterium]
MKRKIILSAVLFVLTIFAGSNLYAKNAIILASFGTTVPEAVKAITNIQERVEKDFPDTEVRLTFTSNIIRSVWKKRQTQADQWIKKGIPEKVLYVKGIIATFGDLQEAGYKNIVVQPTHVFHMEQYQDLKSYVDAMKSIKTIKSKWSPFDTIALGRPALGTIGSHYDYHEDLARAVKIFSKDTKLAKKKNAVLVYMGHGNEHWSTGIYAELQKEMRKAYPGVMTFVGSVEGYPSLEDVAAGLNHLSLKNKRVLVKPLMIVAGDHATNDMAGSEEDSWKSVFEKNGFKVFPVLKGLGSDNDFADIFVDHIRDAAKDAGINL